MRAALFCLIALACLAPEAAHAFGDADRTVQRSVTGEVFYPRHMMNKPEHYEFLPLTSNHDPQHRHDAQWQGQDWETGAWNARWTPDSTLAKFFRQGIFYRQYTGHGGKIPVLEVGPYFYKISDLDQRRGLKLLADRSGVFKDTGKTLIELRDWHTGRVIGSYTPQGLYLK